MSKKKSAQQTPGELTDAYKRIEKYNEACAKAKKGKILAASMIAVTVICLLTLLLVGLKLNGVGMMVNANGNIIDVTDMTTTVAK